MGWRLHLSTQPIEAVHIVAGSPPLVVVWDKRHQVHYYRFDDATPLGDGAFDAVEAPADLQDAVWHETVSTFRAPNGSYLPTVYLNRLTLHQSRDGRMRLYHFHEGDSMLQVEDHFLSLSRDDGGRYLVMGLDRALGLSAACDDDGLLHIFQQHVRVGLFEIGLSLGMDARLNLALPDGAGTLYVCDGERVIRVDSGGRIEQDLRTHFTVGKVAVSPAGGRVALADIDDNLIRVYDADLVQTHQKHAIDLVMDARQVQLLASLPGRKAGLSALDIADDGSIVFALGGVLCVTEVDALNMLPQARSLL